MAKPRGFMLAGNAKMNPAPIGAIAEVVSKLDSQGKTRGITFVYAPSGPQVALASFLFSTADSTIKLAAQNIDLIPGKDGFAQLGAYTGGNSAKLLVGNGAKYILVNHSERFDHFGETPELGGKKAAEVVKVGATPIVCLGEAKAIREASRNAGNSVAVFALLRSEFEKLTANLETLEVLAYEPKWAIGTGLIPTTQEISDTHAFLRKLARDKYGDEIADKLMILYGGSMNPKNAAEILALEDVDGGLMGGVSLKPAEFEQVTLIAHKVLFPVKP